MSMMKVTDCNGCQAFIDLDRVTAVREAGTRFHVDKPDPAYRCWTINGPGICVPIDEATARRLVEAKGGMWE